MNTTHVNLNPTVLLTFVFLVCNLSAIARPPEKIKKKEITNSYSFSSNESLQVENRYRTHQIHQWIENVVTIRV